MKKLSMAAALALIVATPVLAGGPVIVPAEPVIEDPYAGASSSSMGNTGVLIAAAVGIALVAGASDSSSSATTTGN